MEENVAVINKVSTFHEPAKLSSKNPNVKDKTKSRKSKKSSKLADPEKNSTNPVTTPYQKFFASTFELITELFEGARERRHDSTVSQVLDTVVGYLVPNQTAAVLEKIPRVSQSFIRHPVRLLKVDGGDDVVTETFYERLVELCDNNEMNTTAVVVDSSAVQRLGDLGDALVSAYNLQKEGSTSATKETSENDDSMAVIRFLKRLRSQGRQAGISSCVFAFTKSEVLPNDVLQQLITLLYDCGLPSSVILWFQSSAVLQQTVMDSSFMYVIEKFIPSQADSQQLETIIFELIKSKNTPFMFGPKVASTLVLELCASNRSWGHIAEAVKMCCLLYYSSNVVPGDHLNFQDLTTLSDAQLDCYRTLPSFRLHVQRQPPDVQILLLADKKYFLDFLQRIRREHSFFRLLATGLLQVLVTILSDVPALRWCEIYDILLCRSSWEECPALREKSGLEHGTNLIDALEKSIIAAREIGKVKDLTQIAGGLEKKIAAFVKNSQQSSSKSARDDVIRWKQASRRNAPLIELLDEICSLIQPYESLALNEIVVFDDIDGLNRCAKANVKNTIECTMLDPFSLFEKTNELRDSAMKHDMCVVYSSLCCDHRTLNLRSSISTFYQICLEKIDVAADTEENVLPDSVRARFIKCLPALQALGILSLVQRGNKRSYTVV